VRFLTRAGVRGLGARFFVDFRPRAAMERVSTPRSPLLSGLASRGGDRSTIDTPEAGRRPRMNLV
jgi:hypothetical protein